MIFSLPPYHYFDVYARQRYAAMPLRRRCFQYLRVFRRLFRYVYAADATFRCRYFIDFFSFGSNSRRLLMFIRRYYDAMPFLPYAPLRYDYALRYFASLRYA